jgi:hypothetical protein
MFTNHRQFELNRLRGVLAAIIRSLMSSLVSERGALAFHKISLIDVDLGMSKILDIEP